MTARNPACLPTLDPTKDPALCALLRAAGVPAACLPDERKPYTPPIASDYDRFLALAAALPACVGHPRTMAIHLALAAATGIDRPLCPHTAQAHWQGFVSRHWYEDHPLEAEPLELTVPFAPCPLCPPPVSTRLLADEVFRFPGEMITAASEQDLIAWTTTLTEALPPAGKPCLLTLPKEYTFVRPDPYHVGLALRRPAHERSGDEQALLLSQAARVLGETLTAHEDTLLLRVLTPSALEVLPLLTYLRDAGRLPDTVYLSEDPADAATLSGRMTRLRTGVILPADTTTAATATTLAAYARLAPIGRAILLTEEA